MQKPAHPGQRAVDHREPLDDHAADPRQRPAVGGESVVLGPGPQQFPQSLPLNFVQSALRAGDPPPQQGIRAALAPGMVPVVHRLRADSQQTCDLRIRPAALFK